MKEDPKFNIYSISHRFKSKYTTYKFLMYKKEWLECNFDNLVLLLLNMYVIVCMYVILFVLSWLSIYDVNWKWVNIVKGGDLKKEPMKRLMKIARTWS